MIIPSDKMTAGWWVGSFTIITGYLTQFIWDKIIAVGYYIVYLDTIQAHRLHFVLSMRNSYLYHRSFIIFTFLDYWPFYNSYTPFVYQVDKHAPNLYILPILLVDLDETWIYNEDFFEMSLDTKCGWIPMRQLSCLDTYDLLAWFTIINDFIWGALR